MKCDIERLVKKLEALPEELHWSIADSRLIQEVANGVAMKKNKTRLVLNIVARVALKIKLDFFVMFGIGFFAMATIMARCFFLELTKPLSRKKSISSGIPERIFIGFGAAAEDALYEKYCSSESGNVIRINQKNMRMMADFFFSKYMALWSEFLSNFRDARRAFLLLPNDFEEKRSEALIHASVQIAHYSFCKIIFSNLKDRVADTFEICFISADRLAFAAVNSNIRTLYLQHGLVRHSILFPKFSKIVALTHDELSFFRERVPTAQVYFSRQQYVKVCNKGNKSVLVASIPGDQYTMKHVISFLEFIDKEGLEIIVRPHPRENPKFWNAGNFSFRFKFDDSSTFDDSLDKNKPVFVVSWYSTSLVDSLYRGVIPVSVSPPLDNDVEDVVYPLANRSIHWPSEKAAIQSVLLDKEVYGFILKSLLPEEERGF